MLKSAIMKFFSNENTPVLDMAEKAASHTEAAAGIVVATIGLIRIVRGLRGSEPEEGSTPLTRLARTARLMDTVVTLASSSGNVVGKVDAFRNSPSPEPEPSVESTEVAAPEDQPEVSG